MFNDDGKKHPWLSDAGRRGWGLIFSEAKAAGAEACPFSGITCN
tara:strand:+ start:103 stop:234 length:132 start_codon:yes stop_codon:yes gene_type:complete